MDDSRFMRAMLLDFYGALLTDKQRECYTLHFCDDLSLAEIAEQCGVSRQGVWDNIRRADTTLQDIEEKTGLVRRFTRTRKYLEALKKQLESLEKMTDGPARSTVRQALDAMEALGHEE